MPKQNIIVLSLGEQYDMPKLTEVVGLPKLIKEKGVEHIIVDAQDLKQINVMGLEILALKDSLPSSTYSLVFVGLQLETASIFAMLDSERVYGEAVNFKSLTEAVTFLEGLA